MNYEFHVGDYVETVSGAKGYIDQVLSEGSYYFRWVTTDTDNFEFSEFCESYCSDLSKFARIGQYDFTKPEVKQIEKLTYAESYINGYQVLTGRKLIDKINELVDAVNKLKKRNKECSGCTYFEDE